MPDKPRNRNYPTDKIFDAFLNLSRDGIYLVGEDGGFLEVNPAYCNLLGYSREELLILSLPDVETNTSSEAIFRRISAIQVSGAARFETAHCCKDGSMVDVEVSATHIRVKDGVLFLSIVRDLTQRRLVEDEKIRLLALEQSVQGKLEGMQSWLKQQLDFNTGITENLGEGLFVLGRAGLVMFMNPAAERLLGCGRQEMIGRSVCEMVECLGAKDGLFFSQRHKLLSVMNSGELLSVEEDAFMRKDGTPFPVSFTASPLRMEGKISGVVVVFTDITERKKKDAALLHLNRLKDSLISATRIISGKLTLEDKFRETPSTARRLSESTYAVLAFVENEIVTRFFHEGLSPEMLQSLGKWLDARGRSLLNQEKAVIRVSQVSGDPRFASLWDCFPEMNTLIRAPVVYGDQILGIIWLVNKANGKTFTENDQEIIETLAAHAAVSLNNAKLREQIREFNQDLEETVRERTRDLEEAMVLAEMASDAKSRFLSGMSHELRTPLNAIIGFSDVLAEEYVGPLNDKQREYVGDILDSANRLLLLIDDILDVSRIESGRMTLEPEVVKFGALLEDSLIQVKGNADKHAIAIRLEMAAGTQDLSIVADPKKLKQVMFNLLSNAIKFTPDGGIVVMKTGFEDLGSKTIRVLVEDSGIGIAPEHLEKIFEDFLQVQDGIQDKTRGTGLGLSLVKRLVEMHGGRVWAESSGIGKGSRFMVELPVNRFDPKM
ncbi:MAG: PAS domain S-box protein [Deltaproteobacteria bacterium]|nr:PAS domain S-box protein [Deltaproteobacteria bacterium]